MAVASVVFAKSETSTVVSTTMKVSIFVEASCRFAWNVASSSNRNARLLSSSSAPSPGSHSSHETVRAACRQCSTRWNDWPQRLRHVVPRELEPISRGEARKATVRAGGTR